MPAICCRYSRYGQMRIVILGVCAMLAMLVFGAMLVNIWRSRRSCDAHFHRSAAVEAAWAVIPCVMFVACTIPAVKLVIASVSRLP